MDQKYFPEELLNEFADFFDQIIERGHENTVYQDQDLKKFFFEEFIGGIAKRLSFIRELPDTVFISILTIYRTFRW